MVDLEETLRSGGKYECGDTLAQHSVFTESGQVGAQPVHWHRVTSTASTTTVALASFPLSIQDLRGAVCENNTKHIISDDVLEAHVVPLICYLQPSGGIHYFPLIHPYG